MKPTRNITFFSLFLSSILTFSSCTKNVNFGSNKRQQLKKGKYYISNKKNEKKANSNSYINTNVSSVSEEEALFLEDLELQFEKQGAQNVAVGRKVYTQNTIITELTPWDRPDLMGQLGMCRSRNATLMNDLSDDGIINGSVHSACFNQPRTSTRGQMRFTENTYSQLEDWNGDDFHDALHAFLHSCTAFKGNNYVKSKTFSVGTESAG